MSGFSIEKSKKHLDELKEKNLKDKIEVENLEHGRDEVVDARTEIEGADISEEAKEKVNEALSEQREQISNEAERTKETVGDTMKKFEEEIQSIQEANENAKEEEKKLRDRKAVLDHFKMGGIMDQAIAELAEESERTDELNNEALEGRKEAEDLLRQLDNIGK